MILRDILFALRSMRKAPLFTLIIIATLTVAIGANAAVFSVLRAVVLAPLPYAEPQNLVAVFATHKGALSLVASIPDGDDIRAQNRVFTDLAIANSTRAVISGIGKPQALEGMVASSQIFDVLGIQPELGRFFNAAEGKPGSGLPLIISDRLWRTTFGADANVIGRAVTLGGESYRVIGVAPPHFPFPLPTGLRLYASDYWTVLRSDPKVYSRGFQRFALIARLRPGISLAAANADVGRITAELALRHPEEDHDNGARVVSFSDVFIGPVRPLLIAAFGAVIGVLAIACANVANLLLSRGASRDRELAIRFAVGATRRRIISQILTETLLLATISGVLGVALAAALIAGFIAVSPPNFPLVQDIRIDGIAVAYTFAIVGLCALASAIVPALAFSRPQLADALKAAGRGGDASRGARARSALVVIEIAISVALVVTSGLIIRSFITLANVPLGVRIADVRIARNFPPLPATRYRSAVQIANFQRDSIARVLTIPGVRSAAWVNGYTALFRNFSVVDTQIDGHPRPSGQEERVNYGLVSSGYFSTLGIPLLAGRAFTDDDRMGSAPVAIVDELFAQTYFNGNAVGHWINPDDTPADYAAPHRKIVGVVGNVRLTYSGVYGPTIYVDIAQGPVTNVSLAVRVRPGVQVDSAIADAISATDPLVAAPPLLPLQKFADNALAQARLSALLLGSLSLVSLFLAVAGVYGVVSFGVAQRTHEFGIRMALGAGRDAIIRNVVARAARLACVGVLVGVIFAGVAAGLMQSQLFGIGTFDPATYAIVVTLVIAAALLAALIPALRATCIDPVVALRDL